MALLDLWRNDRAQLAEKHVQQVIAFAGDGKLRDGSSASMEFRDYLRHIPSDLLSQYSDECLQTSFQDSGLALQDIVNEIGRRLDFQLTHGRYRGTTNQPGHDGLWADADRHSIVVEVKTTDAYRIDLGTVAGYRQALVKSGELHVETSSMLVVVGRQDTGDLEAQIRGSRYAWDMRVISIDALLRMLKLKEEVEDPSLLKRIHDILIPHEFTRLDPIIEIAFAAVADIKQESEGEGEAEDQNEKRFTPVAFHAECIARIEKHLDITLVKHSRASFSSADETTKVLCAVSRYHERAKMYWFAFHPHQDEFLTSAEHAFVAFGCGDAQTLFVIPFGEFKPRLDYFSKTELPDRFYWHVKIRKTGRTYFMPGRAGTQDFDITKYKI
jgi:hypothetical protein